MAPVIGITLELNDGHLPSVERALRDPIERSGALAIVLPRDTPVDHVDRVLALVDGIVLSGGADVDPAHYGEETHPLTRAIDPAHDAFELALARRALDLDVPILGICRGSQVLAVADGGTLVQDVETLHEGAIVKGIVKNITDYGAFVDLGGIDGLLHITDLAWRRVKHPTEVLSVGDEVTAKVLKFDTEKNRVSLGLKQLGEDPWVGLSRRYPTGTRLFGKVTNLTDYGAFVEVEQGIEGLVHVSEMDWTNKNVHPSKVVQLGDEVEVMILEIDEDRRRISLGMKQCMPNPWEEFAMNHKKADRVKGTIKSITDFGIFVGLTGAIDGLVHLSDLSWSQPGEEAVRNYKKGDEVEAVVLSIDVERERISLGIKQMEGDPFSNFVATHEKGSVVTGTVKTVDAKGAVVVLGGEVEGYLRASEVARDRVEDARTHLKEGDKVTVMIINLDRKNRTINLSIKAKDAAEENEAISRLQSESAANTGGTSLGALLKAKLDKGSRE